MTPDKIHKQYTDVCAQMGDCVFRLQALDAQVKALRTKMDELTKQKAALEAQASQAQEQKVAPSGDVASQTPS